MSEADCFRYLKRWKQKMARARGREQKQQGRLKEKIVPKLRNHPPTFVEQDMNDSISFLSETEMAPHSPPQKKRKRGICLQQKKFYHVTNFAHRSCLILKITSDN